MVIGIDASRANRDFKTGTEWYSYYLITNLVHIDKENKYILYTDKPLSESFLKDLNLNENKNVKVKVLKWPFSYLWTLGRLSLEMIFCRPDVLFVPAHALPLFFPKKTINTVHDIAFISDSYLYNPLNTPNNDYSSSKLINSLVKVLTFGRYRSNPIDYLKWSTSFALRRAKKIISVSDFTKKDILKNYKVKADKIKVIHNGYNNLLYKKIENQEGLDLVLKKYGVEGEFLLYVGRLEKKKNIHNLIEGYAILKENNKEIKEKLVLIGSAGYGYDEMKYMIDDLDLEDDIINLGWVEEADMPYLYNKAKAFVFPSLYEGFGIPVIQAMACSTPTLISDIEVLKEVAGENSLYFDRFNTFDLARKMEKIIMDEDLRKNLSEKGLARSKNFSWRKCAEETLEELINW